MSRRRRRVQVDPFAAEAPVRELDVLADVEDADFDEVPGDALPMLWRPREDAARRGPSDGRSAAPLAPSAPAVEHRHSDVSSDTGAANLPSADGDEPVAVTLAEDDPSAAITPEDREVPVEEPEPDQLRPTMWGVASRWRLTGDAARSVLNEKTRGSGELNLMLAPLRDLEPGQKALISILAREDPSFRRKMENQVKKLTGEVQSLDAGPGFWGRLVSAARVLNWLGRSGYCLLFDPSGTRPVPPWKKQQAVRVTPGLDGQKVLDEAKRKLESDYHLSMVGRIAVFGSNVGDEGERDQLKAQREKLERGFSSFETPEQALVFEPCELREVTTALMPKTVNEVFSTKEAAAFARFPGKETKADGVTIARTGVIPFKPEYRMPVDLRALTAGEGPLGYVERGTDNEYVQGFDVQLLDQHAAVFGSTGTGKSTYLTWLFIACVKADYPTVLLDPHGLLAEDCLDAIVIQAPERLHDVRYLDLSEESHSVAYNPLDVRSVRGIETAVSRVTNLLGPFLQFTASSAPASIRLLRQVLYALAEANLKLPAGQKLTLLQVTDFLEDDEFRWAVVEHSSRMDVRQMFEPGGRWDNLGDSDKESRSAVMLSRFNDLSNTPLFANVFAAPDNKFDIGRLMKEERILIINLARASTKSELGKLMGGMVIPTLVETMDNWGRLSGGRGARCLVDEAHTMFAADPAAAAGMAETRKWDLGFVFSTQLPSQYEGKMLDAIFGNTRTKATFNLDPGETMRLAKSLSGERHKVEPGHISALPNRSMLVRPLAQPSPHDPPALQEPFFVHTPEPAPLLERNRRGQPSADVLEHRERLKAQVMQQSYDALYNDSADMDERRAFMPRNLTPVLRRKMTALALRELQREAVAAIKDRQAEIDADVAALSDLDFGAASETALPLDDFPPTAPGESFDWRKAQP